MLQIVVRRVRWRPLRQPSLRLRLARIFHSLCHRHDHSPAGGSYDGDCQGICGLSRIHAVEVLEIECKHLMGKLISTALQLDFQSLNREITASG